MVIQVEIVLVNPALLEFQALTKIADQFQYWLKNRSEKWGAPVLEAPQEERRDDFVQKYLRGCPADRVALILKAREPARILVASGGELNDSRTCRVTLFPSR